MVLLKILEPIPLPPFPFKEMGDFMKGGVALCATPPKPLMGGF